MSDSVTLVDAMVVITGYQQSWFERLARAIPLGVTGQVVREATFYVREDGTEVRIDLNLPLSDGTLRLEHASLDELTEFAAVCQRSGLGSGEIESIAIVLARGFDFCTADVRAMRAMNDLGLKPRWRALEDLFESSSIDSSAIGPEYRRGAWP